MPRRPGGLGASDIWVSTRPTADDPWGEPVNLGSIINSEHHERAPHISADGLSLIFDSDRPGGMGSSDIWMATRASVRSSWQDPVNLGPEINAEGWEGQPSASDSGLTLYFCSVRQTGYGQADIWMAERATLADAWGTPISLGPLVNTACAELGPEVSPDGSTLYFYSWRPGGPGFWDLWQVPIRQASVDLTRDKVLMSWARSLVEAGFGKGVTAQEN
jgi:Tol biopolymer transport system component